MSDHKPIGAFRDDDNDISLGRIIVFMVTILGMLIIGEGGYITWHETFKQLGYIIFNGAVTIIPRTNNGIQLCTFGLGLIGEAFGLKGWQRMSEARIAATPVGS